MRFQTLNDWLAWQEQLHPWEIDLGLDRVAAVASRLDLLTPAYTAISVAGTNGKGSTVAMLEAIYAAAGYRVGAYTSPHLLHYNERIRVQGELADDAAICEAFAHIDDARGETSLTYFEFGTLAAFDIFRRAQVDIAILEVGLGGRLDAVNILDADVAVISSIGIDHTAWLGETREAIACEKAGILRPGRAAVCGDARPPAALEEIAAELETPLHILGRDFGYATAANGWNWWAGDKRKNALPLPNLKGTTQLGNAASVLKVLDILHERHPVNQMDIRAGLANATLPGRFQVLPGAVTTILDVAHNPQAAEVLAQNLSDMHCLGRTHAVIAMLADKDIAAVLAAVAPRVDQWYLASLDLPRGAAANALEQALPAGATAQSHANVAQAYATALANAAEGDRIVVFGSFYTVAAATCIETK